MTKDSRKKKDIRARMAVTGESYMQAKRAVEAERAAQKTEEDQA